MMASIVFFPLLHFYRLVLKKAAYSPMSNGAICGEKIVLLVRVLRKNYFVCNNFFYYDSIDLIKHFKYKYPKLNIKIFEKKRVTVPVHLRFRPKSCQIVASFLLFVLPNFELFRSFRQQLCQLPHSSHQSL